MDGLSPFRSASLVPPSDELVPEAKSFGVSAGIYKANDRDCAEARSSSNSSSSRWSQPAESTFL